VFLAAPNQVSRFNKLQDPGIIEIFEEARCKFYN
jgi:hypothetical protein